MSDMIDVVFYLRRLIVILNSHRAIKEGLFKRRDDFSGRPEDNFRIIIPEGEGINNLCHLHSEKIL